jgi:hypothetical protein
MRYFLLFFVVLVVGVVVVAGRRGDTSRRPPIEIWNDMDRQLKLRPQSAANLSDDGLGSRLNVAGTVARGEPFAGTPYNTGLVSGSTNFVEVMPVSVTPALMARGRERYNISCSPCHGAVGDGNGITKKIGAMAVVANLHDPRIVGLPDGDIYNTIRMGKGLMGGYGANISVEDRWAIVAYLRALQLARLGSPADVPAEFQSQLLKN